MRRKAMHPAMKYAEDVIAGKILVGKYARLFVERHMRDLDQGKHRGLYFDEEAAQEILDFFGELKHSKGRWAGQPILLESWQQFRHWVLFGWKNKDTGLRRFRKAYNEVARKNGKSTEAAGIALKLAFFDGEPGSEVYAAATKRDQAMLVFKEAKRMIKKSAELREMIDTRVGSLFDDMTDSTFQPLGKDADSLDGLNPSGVIIDELHAHKSHEMLDVMTTATGSRDQPLLYMITTAGNNFASVCYNQHTYASRLLNGEIEDDSFYAYIASIDEDDDWQDESCWIKANPNLGVSVSLKDMQDNARQAAQMPSAQNGFIQKRLNRWVKQVTRFIDMDIWDACAGCDPHDYRAISAHIKELERHLRERRSVGGLDLGRADDTSSFTLLFPADEEDDIHLIQRFWMPEAAIDLHIQQGRTEYAAWANDGWIKVTPGNVVDYRTIREDIISLHKLYPIIDMAYDKTYAGQLVQDLADVGIETFPLSQQMWGMGAPTREFERLLLEHRFHHGGHPVLREHADATSVKEDSNGHIKPVKPERASGKKIDGIVSSIFATDRLIRHEDSGPSVYEKRGIRTL